MRRIALGALTWCVVVPSAIGVWWTTRPVPSDADLGLPTEAEGEAALAAVFDVPSSGNWHLAFRMCERDVDDDAHLHPPPPVTVRGGHVLGTVVVPHRPARAIDRAHLGERGVNGGPYARAFTDVDPPWSDALLPENPLGWSPAWLAIAHLLRDAVRAHRVDLRIADLGVHCQDAADPRPVVIDPWAPPANDATLVSEPLPRSCDTRCTLYGWFPWGWWYGHTRTDGP